eukprot:EC124658.1.p1 GENE.EC124658.1~~EC124658.1.p1  ORF type:complete len:167 (+),score=30.80 EC124658.1:95-595(+)
MEALVAYPMDLMLSSVAQPAVPIKRRRGRPPKSSYLNGNISNNVTTTMGTMKYSVEMPIKKRRGRPPKHLKHLYVKSSVPSAGSPKSPTILKDAKTSKTYLDISAYKKPSMFSENRSPNHGESTRYSSQSSAQLFSRDGCWPRGSACEKEEGQTTKSRGSRKSEAG